MSNDRRKQIEAELKKLDKEICDTFLNGVHDLALEVFKKYDADDCFFVHIPLFWFGKFGKYECKGESVGPYLVDMKEDTHLGMDYFFDGCENEATIEAIKSDPLIEKILDATLEVISEDFVKAYDSSWPADYAQYDATIVTLTYNHKQGTVSLNDHIVDDWE